VQTGSTHLARLEAGGLVEQRKQGRHRYFSLADEGVGAVLESIMGLAARKGHTRTRTGPKDPALRKARICYDHLAGELAVSMFDTLRARKLIIGGNGGGDGDLALSPEGRAFARDFGIDVESLDRARRPVCRSCLDWSARRSHLAGALGTAFLDRFYALRWAERRAATRVIAFSARGEAAFRETFAA
jgi:hypothetical protein